MDECNTLYGLGGGFRVLEAIPLSPPRHTSPQKDRAVHCFIRHTEIDYGKYAQPAETKQFLVQWVLNYSNFPSQIGIQSCHQTPYY